MEPFSLSGRTAVVTGASRGIGAATARALDQAGARVALVARSRSDLEEVARGLEQTPIDVGTKVLQELDRVDILVNNAAAAARLDTVDTDAEAIDEMLAVNIRAPLLLIATVIPSMIEHTSGSIINLSSVSALVGTPRRAAYAASKGGLDAATRSLAMELGPSGIRVNSVAPGVVDTALWAKNRGIPGVIEKIEAQTPLGRWAIPDDIADVIVFLASDAARFVTGETITADGGMARTFDLHGGSV
jgi:gluconate 5-dehydrogenase/3-oxoacyl-[acyl-carrier protein] reductase